MPTADELIQRARDLAPGIKARAAEVAKLRRPHDDSIRELIDAEIVQMLVPKRYGGSEADFSTVYDVVKPIAEACPSTGWISAFYILHNQYVAKYPQKAQEELYAENGYVLMPTAAAPDLKAERVDGGWKISGKAVWGSGVMHADWVMISGNTAEGPRAFLMPVEEVEVLDTWFYIGMSGTGSTDYVAKDVFIPEHRSVSMIEFFGGPTEGSQLHDNPFYSIPFFIAALTSITPVLTGALSGMLAEYKTIVERRVRAHIGTVVKDQQHAHVTLGGLEIATRMVDELARSGFAQIEQALASRPFTVDDRLDTKGRVAFISNLCRDTANDIMKVGGSSSFHNDHALQRYWCDLNVLCSHAFWDWDVTRELVGRHKLGLELNNPLV